MEKKTAYRDVEVVYNDHGEGICIVLLHGYLESKEIWHSFVGLFQEGIRLIAPDLPGHGISGIWGNEHSMDDLAGSVVAVLEAEHLEKVFLVGHSMGGYVAMAFAELYPEKLLGYSLFHSTCYADSDEKKNNRDREISLVLCHKKSQIINVNIPKAFADENVERLMPEVERAKQVAHGTSEKGMIAVLHGMKGRSDRTRILKNPDLPLLLIGGMKDNYIPVEVFEQLLLLAPHASVLRLKSSGHMGFVEEPELAVEAIMGMVTP